MEKLLTPDDVAELLGLQRDYVVKQAREGNIPALKIGKAWRFRRSTIERSLALKERRRWAVHGRKGLS
jgi:excisionase family DNA binding protein